LDKAGEKPTENKKATISIDIYEGHFNVRLNGFISFGEMYYTLVALLQHMEEHSDEIVDNSMSTMLH
jgi:hypothetical protein